MFCNRKNRRTTFMYTHTHARMPRKKSERENVMSSLIEQHSHNITYAYVYSGTYARSTPQRHSHVCTTFWLDRHDGHHQFFLHSISFASASSFIWNIVFCFVLSFIFLLLLLFVFKFWFCIRATWCSFHMVHPNDHIQRNIVNMRDLAYIFFYSVVWNFIVVSSVCVSVF